MCDLTVGHDFCPAVFTGLCCLSTTGVCKECEQLPCVCEKEVCADCGDKPCSCVRKVTIKIGKTKILQLNHMIRTSFWSADGQPLPADEFISELFNKLPKFYTSEVELIKIWSDPKTRKILLNELDEHGYSLEALNQLRDLVADSKTDIFDVLEFLSFDRAPITREERVRKAKQKIHAALSVQQREFVEFVLSRYLETGVEVLDREWLSELLRLKYGEIEDAVAVLGNVQDIANTFTDFQRYLYEGIAV